ncbi:MAG: Gx transporter family protein [Clostridia bacterium]|nr:Gx transporter family protein [Clostridia bacterium]
MSAKQGDNRNKITPKRLSLWGMLCCLCLIFSFLEAQIPLDFIAPGIKLGLSNSVALILVMTGDIKGAFAVNIARIFLSALLFSSPFSLVFSLSGGMCSLVVSAVCSRSRHLSGVGISMLSAFAHNIAQTAAAFLVLGISVLYYLPLLLLSAAISGGVIGIICNIIFEKMKTTKEI